MKTINIHEAKTHLSRLVEQAVEGEPFIIAKAGKPLVKVSALTTSDNDQIHRTGFLAGAFKVPNDFDRMGEDEITELFNGS
jgi:prevent-host-death family protein